jgi:hypothetical protein
MKIVLEVLGIVGGLSFIIGFFLKMLLKETPAAVDALVDLAESNPEVKKELESHRTEVEAIADAAVKELHKKLDPPQV